MSKDKDHWDRVKPEFKDGASNHWGLFLSEHPSWTKGDFGQFKPPDPDDGAGGGGHGGGLVSF